MGTKQQGPGARGGSRLPPGGEEAAGTSAGTQAEQPPPPLPAALPDLSSLWSWTRMQTASRKGQNPGQEAAPLGLHFRFLSESEQVGNSSLPPFFQLKDGCEHLRSALSDRQVKLQLRLWTQLRAALCPPPAGGSIARGMSGSPLPQGEPGVEWTARSPSQCPCPWVEMEDHGHGSFQS